MVLGYFLRQSLPIVASLALLGGFAYAQSYVPVASSNSSAAISLQLVGRYAPESRAFGAGAAEIVAHDPLTQRMFIVNGQTNSIDIVSIADLANPSLLSSIAIAPAYGSGVQSVAFKEGILAAAVAASTKTDPGLAVFFDSDGNYLGQATAGALPDMITFTHDGLKVLVANEGEPNSYGKADSVDPEGSVTIVDLSAGPANASSMQVSFAEFNVGAARHAELPADVRIFGPNATVAQDLEPEYITISADNSTAYVTLQENNAIAEIDIASGQVLAIRALGFKDHSLVINGIDSSDRDGVGNTALINIGARPVLGMYQPDSLAVYELAGQRYLVTANEGDARDYSGFAEESRVSGLSLDPSVFPAGSTSSFARLQVSKTLGDANNDGLYEQLYAFGARSFSIWNADTGALVYDSGDDFEQLTANMYPHFFNASNDDIALDSRSDNKGPEPEGLTLGVVAGRTLAFVGLERIGGVMVYDISDPNAPSFVQYINNRDFTKNLDDEWQQAGDLGPEGLLFVPASESPSNKPLLIVGNEVSGTTSIYQIDGDTLASPTAEPTMTTPQPTQITPQPTTVTPEPTASTPEPTVTTPQPTSTPVQAPSYRLALPWVQR
jgi:2',3'-cyclic-nucleotide 2'-phosphodiesterase/3'-nucleotidase/5'-nucleotidase